MDARASRRVPHLTAALGAVGVLLSFGPAFAQEKEAGPGGTTATTVEKKVDSGKTMPSIDILQLRSAVLEAVLPPEAAHHLEAEARREVVRRRTVAVANGLKARLAEKCQPLLFSELALIRSVCPMTMAQRTQIREAGDRALDEAVKAFVGQGDNGVRILHGQWAPGPDVRRILLDKLMEALEKTLPAEAVARYRRELAERRADERRTAIGILVDRLDRALFLSADQRAKLSEALATRWDDSWWLSLRLVQTSSQSLPWLPDSVILPLLEDEQKEVWGSASKIQLQSGIPWNGIGGMPTENPLADEMAEGIDRGDERPRERAARSPQRSEPHGRE